jgi:lipopolysaccharide export system protein LptA
MRTPLPAFACAVLLLGTLAAHAEKADREKEIVVNADRLVADDAKKTSTFEGNVIVTQGSMRMTAEKVTVREDAQRHKFYVATGNPVTFRQKLDNSEERVEGYAQRAEFDDLNDVLHLHDKALVKRDQNEITGDFISYDMRRELAEVTGAQSGGAPPNRVKAVMLPKKSDEKPRPAAGAPTSPASTAPRASPAPAPPAANPPLELKTDPGKS